MSTYYLRALVSVNFLDSVSDATVSDMSSYIFKLFYNFKGSDLTDKSNSCTISKNNFVDASLKNPTYISNSKYINCELLLDVPTGQDIVNLQITGLYFVKGSTSKPGTTIILQDKYRYSYYLLRNSATDTGYTDLKTPYDVHNDWEKSSSSQDHYYKNIYIDVVTDYYNANYDKPICTSVQFCGFNKLDASITNLKYWFGSSKKKYSLSLGSASYTTIVSTDNTDFDDLTVGISDFKSSLTTLAPQNAFNRYGYQRKYTVLDSVGNKTSYYGGFGSYNEIQFGNAFRNLFTTIPNKGLEIYPNSNFRDLYPSRALHSTSFNKYEDIKTVQWYSDRFIKRDSYTSGSTKQVQSALYSYLWRFKTFNDDVTPDTKIKFVNNNLVISSRDVLTDVVTSTYKSYCYLATYFLGPLNVSYANMYNSYQGFYDIYYNESYKFSNQYDLHKTYLTDFGKQSSIGKDETLDGKAHYTGWVDNNQANYNDKFKEIYNKQLKYKIALYGSYIALSDTNNSDAVYYNLYNDNIYRGSLQKYTVRSYVFHDLKTVSPSTKVTAEDFWGVDTAYKAVFMNFDQAIDWGSVFNKTRIQSAFYNGNKTSNPYVNWEHTYVGIRLLLDTVDGSSIEFYNDWNKLSGGRTNGLAYLKAGKLKLPINIQEIYTTYYTYYATDESGLGGTYNREHINLPKGNLLYNEDGLLGHNKAEQNSLNSWKYDLTQRQIIQPVNNMLVGEYTYSTYDSSDVALGGNSQVVIYPLVSCSIQNEAVNSGTLQCSFNGMVSSKFTSTKVNYKLSYASTLSSDEQSSLGELVTGSDKSAKTVGTTLTSLSKTELGALKDQCTFNIYKVLNENGDTINYTDLNIIVNCANSDYKFSQLTYATNKNVTASQVGTAFTITRNNSSFNGIFKYSGGTYTVTISGINFNTVSDFSAASKQFNFVDPNNDNGDNLFIINGFYNTLYTDSDQAIDSFKIGSIEYLKDQEINLFATNHIFEFPHTAIEDDLETNPTYYTAYSFNTDGTKDDDQLTVKHSIYMNQYFKMNTYKRPEIHHYDYNLAGFSDVITIKPYFTDKQKKVSYIYIGPESNYNKVLAYYGQDLVNKLAINHKIAYKTFDQFEDAYVYGLDTLQSKSIYDDSTGNFGGILSRSYIQGAIDYFFTGNHSQYPEYSGYNLNLELITDKTLPVFELNNNLYKYKNEQSNSTLNATSFGNVKPIKTNNDLILYAYYKPLDVTIDSDGDGTGDRIAESISSKAIRCTSNNNNKHTHYILNDYNYTYSRNAYSTLFEIPIVDTELSNVTCDEAASSQALFVLDDILVWNNNGDKVSFYNSYLNMTSLESLNGAYIKTDLSRLTTVAPNTFYDYNSLADRKFAGIDDSDYNFKITHSLKREIAKLVMSYYSLVCMQDSESQWNSWSPTLKKDVKTFEQLYNKLPMYESSYNGVGVGLYLCGSNISNRASYLSTYPGLYDEETGNQLKNKYSTIFAGDSKSFSKLSDFGSNVFLNSYIETTFNIKNTCYCYNTTNGTTSYFRFKINDEVIRGICDGENSYINSITFPYGISFQDVYTDSKRSLTDTSLVKLYEGISASVGTSNLALPVNTLEITNIGTWDDATNTVIWDETADSDNICNYSITKKQGSDSYWDTGLKNIDLSYRINSDWISTGQSININADTSKNTLTTVDISDLISITNYNRIPYFISGVTIKLEDTMFDDVETGKLYGKSNLYNYLKTLYLNGADVTNMNQTIEIYITDMYFSADGKKPGSISIGNTSGDFRLQFCVSRSKITNWDATNNINNKKVGNYGHAIQQFSDGVLTIQATNLIDITSLPQDESVYIYKFYSDDNEEQSNSIKNYKLFTRLLFDKDLYVSYKIFENNQKVGDVFTQRLNLLNNLTVGYMQFNQVDAKRVKHIGQDAYWATRLDNLPIFTLTNDMIAQVCPVMDNSIYFKAIKDKPYTITYVLYDTSAASGHKAILRVDTVDQIINIQKDDGNLYRYLKINNIDYNGIIVKGYTIRLSDGYKFTE